MTLTKPQIEMLRRLANGGLIANGISGRRYYAGTKTEPPVRVKLSTFNSLRARKLIGWNEIGGWSITDAGRAALAEAEGKK